MPASMRAAWAEELERWLPALLPGTIKMWCVSLCSCRTNSRTHTPLHSAGLDDTDGINSARVFLVTYDLLTRGESLRQRLMLTNPGLVIVDESHYCKNIDAKRTKVLKNSSCAFIAILLSSESTGCCLLCCKKRLLRVVVWHSCAEQALRALLSNRHASTRIPRVLELIHARALQTKEDSMGHRVQRRHQFTGAFQQITTHHDPQEEDRCAHPITRQAQAVRARGNEYKCARNAWRYERSIKRSQARQPNVRKTLERMCYGHGRFKGSVGFRIFKRPS